MIINDYSYEDYTNPINTYEKISDKLKIGHLIYNNDSKKIILVTPNVLSEIFEKEKNSDNKKYSLIFLKDNWLTKIFNFKSQYLNSQYMTVYRSNSHGLKIHDQNSRFYIGYRFKEKMDNIPGMIGELIYKPNIFFINELMDYLFLIKKEHFEFSDNDLEKINELIGKSIKTLK